MAKEDLSNIESKAQRAQMKASSKVKEYSSLMGQNAHKSILGYEKAQQLNEGKTDGVI